MLRQIHPSRGGVEQGSRSNIDFRKVGMFRACARLSRVWYFGIVLFREQVNVTQLGIVEKVLVVSEPNIDGFRSEAYYAEVHQAPEIQL